MKLQYDGNSKEEEEEEGEKETMMDGQASRRAEAQIYFHPRAGQWWMMSDDWWMIYDDADDGELSRCSVVAMTTKSMERFANAYFPQRS